MLLALQACGLKAETVLNWFHSVHSWLQRGSHAERLQSNNPANVHSSQPVMERGSKVTRPRRTSGVVTRPAVIYGSLPLEYTELIILNDMKVVDVACVFSKLPEIKVISTRPYWPLLPLLHLPSCAAHIQCSGLWIFWHFYSCKSCPINGILLRRPFPGKV